MMTVRAQLVQPLLLRMLLLPDVAVALGRGEKSGSRDRGNVGGVLGCHVTERNIALASRRLQGTSCNERTCSGRIAAKGR